MPVAHDRHRDRRCWCEARTYRERSNPVANLDGAPTLRPKQRTALSRPSVTDHAGGAARRAVNEAAIAGWPRDRHRGHPWIRLHVG
jgi:hypothetical protein